MFDNKSFTLIEPCLPCLPAGRRQGRSSFTLIELLIVIGILAILVAAVVIALNPAQLLAQARDGKRQQDLSALTQALNTIYALDQSLSFGTSSIVYTSLPDSTTTCATWNLPSLPSGWNYHCVSTSTLQNTNGTGWIPVNFQSNGVVSLSALPTDPINTSSTGLYYTYVTGGSYELTAAFESSKYKLGGDKDIASTDGGLYPDLYELGSNLALQPLDHGDASLVGYWPLDEGTGTIAYDRSGKGNNGTWYGTSTARYVAGKVGSGAGTFNGVSDYVSIPASLALVPGAENVSVAAWINFTTGQADKGIYSGGLWGAVRANGYGLVMDSDGTSVRLEIGGSLVKSGPLNDGSWHWVVGLRNGLTLYTYIDGVLRISSVFASINDANQVLIYDIGQRGAGVGFFGGLIDDIRIYNRALSASEIQALYNAAK